MRAGERYQITVIALTEDAPASCSALVRPLGAGGGAESVAPTSVPLRLVTEGRHWYRQHLQPVTADFEWQVTCVSAHDSSVLWVAPHAGGWATVIVV